MNLVEFEAKALLRNAGVPVPEGIVLRTADPAPVLTGPALLKAQIPEGGRGKRGLVVRCDPDEAEEALARLRARMRRQGWDAPVVLAEQSIGRKSECYLAWSIDDVAQSLVLCFSPEGGVDIESHRAPLARLAFAFGQTPAAHDFVAFFQRAGFSGRSLGALSRFACATWRVFVQQDAQLLEINPLAVQPSGDVMALDAKLVVDDNAVARHGEWAGLASARFADGATELERRAARHGFTFIELEGETALFAGGAGIGMAILDQLADAGIPAANFADASGGSSQSVFEELGRITFDWAERPEVKAILMYFTLAATSVASVVQGLLALLETRQPPKPLVIGLLCSGAGEREMTFAQARALLASRGLRCEANLDAAVAALREARAEAQG